MTSDFSHARLRVLPVATSAPEPACVIDCDTCAVRGPGCDDCVVSVMLGGPPEVVAPEERRALDVLAQAGLVPALRMTPPEDPGGEP